ncbi:MAG: hypothetical protein WAV09_03405 [Minisyncoccia bacterium]
MPYGYAPSALAVRLLDVGTQENSLREMHGILERASIHPDVVTVAKMITQDCASRDDKCELLAIFDAVRDGNPNVAPLRNGVRYVRDPRHADYFTSPVDLLRQCMTGACAEDCDGHALLVAALAAALGWKSGLRAYGTEDGFSHVYAVVAFPKLPVKSGSHLIWEQVLGLDTTVPRSNVGWEPPRANVLTAWLE